MTKKVLIVDDERTFLLSLSDGLTEYRPEFEVVTSVNGKEAVNVLKAKGIDLVVTDLRMPEMDGFELLNFLLNTFPQIPVIFMTAFGTPKIDHTIRAQDRIQYIEKPFE